MEVGTPQADSDGRQPKKSQKQIVQMQSRDAGRPRPEAEEAPRPAAAARGAPPGGAGSGSSASSSEEESSEEEATSGEEPTDVVTPMRVKLFKLGQHCCDAVASYVAGNEQSEQLEPSLQIDQRATLDRCRDHMQWAGELTTVWSLGVATPRGRSAYKSLCEYFVAKQRVGLVETPSCSIYIVPPNEMYFKELGLPASRQIIGLQIPTSAGDMVRSLGQPDTGKHEA